MAVLLDSMDANMKFLNVELPANINVFLVPMEALMIAQSFLFARGLITMVEFKGKEVQHQGQTVLDL